MNTITAILAAVILVVLIYFGGCSYNNVGTIKAYADDVWNRNGYDVVGYEGYQIGNFVGQPGGKVWYIVKRKGRDGVTYHGYISKWGNEFHIYHLTAIDAISPNQ